MASVVQIPISGYNAEDNSLPVYYTAPRPTKCKNTPISYGLYKISAEEGGILKFRLTSALHVSPTGAGAEMSTSDSLGMSADRRRRYSSARTGWLGHAAGMTRQVLEAYRRVA